MLLLFIIIIIIIRGRSRKFKPFVANSVGEIQGSTNPDQWQHISTGQNPADLLTRGLSISKLIKDEKWWNGQSFLKQEPTEWPETKIEIKKAPDIEVRKPYQETGWAGEQTFLASASEDCLVPQRFSSWSKLTRVSTRVNRFLEHCRLPSAIQREGALKPDEITVAGMSVLWRPLWNFAHWNFVEY